MKVTSKIIITLSLSLLISGCDEDKEHKNVKIFKNVDECISVHFNRQYCQEEYDKNVKQFSETSPKYNSIGECEEKFGIGKCQQNNQSQSSFTPIFMGYMIGRLTSPSGDSYYRSAPIYPYTSNGNYYNKQAFLNNSGDTLKSYSNNPYSRSDFSRSNSNLSPVISPVSRGGFGSTAKSASVSS